MSGDDEYLALLRGTLPSDEEKARARQRLAALGVTVAAAQVAPLAAAKASASAFSFALLGKAFLVAGGAAVITFAVVSSRDVPPVKPLPAPVARVEPPPPARTAAEPAPSEPVGDSLAKVKRARKVRAPVAPADTLAAENALLSAAVRAMHAGDTVEAARLLDEHARTYPRGILVHERERARNKLAGD